MFALARYRTPLRPTSNRLLQLCLGLSLVAVVAGCGKAVQSDLPGTYVADYGFATDTLVIKGDGHYTQTVKVKASGKVIVASGTWSFDPQDQRIALEGLMGVDDPTGKPVPNIHQEKDSVWSKDVLRWFGRLQIGGDPAVPYYRQPDQSPH
jgi:hypothetical protein